jgi:hypothetical protein
MPEMMIRSLGELLRFLWRRPWMIPIMLLLLLTALLMAAEALGPLSPFLYPL